MYFYATCKVNVYIFQIIITSVNSWTESLEWRLPSRMQCLSIFLIRWLPLYWMQREVGDGTWEFWVNPPFLFYSLFINIQHFFHSLLFTIFLFVSVFIMIINWYCKPFFVHKKDLWEHFYCQYTCILLGTSFQCLFELFTENTCLWYLVIISHLNIN